MFLVKKLTESPQNTFKPIFLLFFYDKLYFP